ncbi:hypothetical protein MHAS_01763 [Mycolicibacterium hassiacum DSM 44199]|uniref:DUF732 domain-containing protein n=3 Tax=Mycolicibacterium hassiacum TaxID=46351 RepID=UPI000DB74FF1|nr:DUF732 domain-containing protein [Mycolicibacterium hassiacum]MDA4088519.1 hypothetical protein [Mycolicibacterium hassiacum DSM 44199]PZN22752.1 MAG: DUF732 domain-containing protein [Mycolicibacterium hassiacum]VCT90059.1 hypothetical protein MHAS_01763 [Mycolicibacterium hassiacum DSM 44199]
MKRALIATVLAATSLLSAVPAQADVDTDFSNELQVYGIYGQKDYYAWIGKITCKRLDRGTDTDIYASAKFVQQQLNRGQDSTEQAWQFLGAALRTYCPHNLHYLEQAAR